MMLTRRSILRGLIAAPAIVSAGSIMPVKLWPDVYVATWGADEPLGAGYIDARMIATMTEHEFDEFRINWGYYRQERGLPFALPFHGSCPIPTSPPLSAEPSFSSSACSWNRAVGLVV
jgi:hypothetical protein